VKNGWKKRQRDRETGRQGDGETGRRGDKEILSPRLSVPPTTRLPVSLSPNPFVAQYIILPIPLPEAWPLAVDAKWNNLGRQIGKYAVTNEFEVGGWRQVGLESIPCEMNGTYRTYRTYKSHKSYKSYPW
jgi:hypothetical protein